MNLPLITAMVSALGIWAKFCNIAFQFHSLPFWLPSFLPKANFLPAFLPCFLASFLPSFPSFLPSFLFLSCFVPSFLPSFLPFFLFDVFLRFDASPALAIYRIYSQPASSSLARRGDPERQSGSKGGGLSAPMPLLILVTSLLLIVVRPGAPSSVLAPSSKARSP